MRTPRKETLLPFGACHKMWRCHNREPLLAPAEEREAYLDALFASYARARDEGVRFHAFAIMPNHAHEVVSIGARVEPFSEWMRRAHGRFGLDYNRRHQRLGKVSCERPKTVALEDDRAILTVMFYTDANSLKAGLVESAADWAWGSHAYYAYGVENRWSKLLDPPQAYLDLGDTPEERQEAYREGYAAYVASKGLVDLGSRPQRDGSPDAADRSASDYAERSDRQRAWLSRLVEGDPGTGPAFGAPAYVEQRREAIREWARGVRQRAGPSPRLQAPSTDAAA